jgi:putative hydrolase of the HAD superfamily
MGIRAVAFDLDYTLAVPVRDRETLLAEAVDAVDGAPPLTRKSYLRAHSNNLTADTREPVFAALLEQEDSADDIGDDATLSTALAEAYRERVTDALVPVEGVEPMLAELREEYQLGLLTNGPVLAQRSKLTHLGWTDAFDAALVTGELPAGKPDRTAFEALLDALDSEPAATVFVGDRVGDDIEGAANAGLVPIQVRYDGGPDPSPLAEAHVRRPALPTALPALLETLSE